MTEYIERSKIFEAYEEVQRGTGPWRFEVLIDSIPSADVAPVRHGHWICDGGNEYVDHYHCSECGSKIDLCNEIYTEPKPNYCKNCGARMDKETNDA